MDPVASRVRSVACRRMAAADGEERLGIELRPGVEPRAAKAGARGSRMRQYLRESRRAGRGSEAPHPGPRAHGHAGRRRSDCAKARPVGPRPPAPGQSDPRSDDAGIGFKVLQGHVAEIDTTAGNSRLIFGIFAALVGLRARADQRTDPRRNQGGAPPADVTLDGRRSWPH